MDKKLVEEIKEVYECFKGSTTFCNYESSAILTLIYFLKKGDK